jgi:hypothetical protein
VPVAGVLTVNSTLFVAPPLFNGLPPSKKRPSATKMTTQAASRVAVVARGHNPPTSMLHQPGRPISLAGNHAPVCTLPVAASREASALLSRGD